jgi:hypothetical protein
MSFWQKIAAWFRQWGPLIVLILFLIGASATLIPRDIWFLYPNRIRAVVAAFFFGGLVGISEIASRYRDEPLKAVMSPYGLIYCLLNGYIAVLAFFLIIHFPGTFGSLSKNDFLAALTAGFGSTIVMRSRIAIIKTADGNEESVGPDYVIKIILQIIDTNIDRWRAVRRQVILGKNLAAIKKLGDFSTAWLYLSASLFAFQNLDDARKKTLRDTYNDYQTQKAGSEDIKRLGLGFIFLTLVGESNFSAVIENAANLSSDAPATSILNLPTPSVPADLATPTPAVPPLKDSASGSSIPPTLPAVPSSPASDH